MNIEKIIARFCNANFAHQLEHIQSLWSGYGSITRYATDNPQLPSVIVKHIQLPVKVKHPRGWHGEISHQRKIRSYQVEANWYQQYAAKTNNYCRVPHSYGVYQVGDEMLLILEDLDAAGFPLRLQQVNIEQIFTCLDWLANFHAQFLYHSSDNLWPIGTYWHLATRPEELQALNDPSLKAAAPLIDNILNQATYQTLVHGDAKLANFCFSKDKQSVAAVDFQYIGGGCGMKDVVYFISSCLYEEDCQRYEQQLLEHYFASLNKALEKSSEQLNFNYLEREWRELYPFAWADFQRFLKGWSPTHWKIHRYSQNICKQVINSLNK